MALVPTEEQTLLSDSIRELLANDAPVALVRRLRDANDADGFSRPLWARFADMGFSGVLVPEAHGGVGLGHAEAGVLMEAIGGQLSASPLLASGVVAATAMLHAGSDAQCVQWLPLIASGERIATLAVDEKSKHAPEHIALAATATTAGWRLDGSKTFVVDGHAADLFIVAARSAGKAGEREGITLFLLPGDAPGLQLERVSMVDSRPVARLRLDGVQLGPDAVLGRPHEGAGPLAAALEAGRTAVAAELLGVAEAAFQRTLGYLKERRQFGRLIGEFQALQHRMATLYCDIALTRAAVLKAQQQMDSDVATAAAAVAIAKARAGATATLAVQEAVQLHGGMGMTDEFDAGLFMKRARVLQELYGDAAFQLDRLARLRGY